MICGVFEGFEMGRMCSIHGRDGKYTFLLKKSEAKRPPGGLDIDGKMILRWNVDDVMLCAGFICLRILTIGSLFEHGKDLLLVLLP
jgi:hypothetical protein